MAEQLVQAVLSHSTVGRARLRFHIRGDGAFFERVGTALAQHPDVDQVRVNPRTGSILLLHRGALADILGFAAQEKLFEVARGAEHAPMRRVELAIAELDVLLSRETRGAFGLGTATFVGLFAAGVYQLAQGKFLPAGMTLINYALNVMHREAEREARTSPTRPDPVSSS